MIQFIFVNKIGRNFQFPTFEQLIDVLIFICSIICNEHYLQNYKNPLTTSSASTFNLS